MLQDTATEKQRMFYKPLARVISGVFLFLAIYLAFNVIDQAGYEKKSVETAENYLKHQVYMEIGVVPERITTTTIYKHDGKYIIVAKYALQGRGWDGSCCVYCMNGFLMNATGIMPADYSYKEKEMRAFFGV